MDNHSKWYKYRTNYKTKNGVGCSVFLFFFLQIALECFVLLVGLLLVIAKRLPLGASHAHIHLGLLARRLNAQLRKALGYKLVVGRRRALGLVLLRLLHLLLEERLDVLGRLSGNLVRLENLVDRVLLGRLRLGRLRLGLLVVLLLVLLGVLLLVLGVLLLVLLGVLLRLLDDRLLRARPELLTLLQADNPRVAVAPLHERADLLRISTETKPKRRNLLASVGHLGRVLAGHLRSHSCLYVRSIMMIEFIRENQFFL